MEIVAYGFEGCGQCKEFVDSMDKVIKLPYSYIKLPMDQLLIKANEYGVSSAPIVVIDGEAQHMHVSKVIDMLKSRVANGEG